MAYFPNGSAGLVLDYQCMECLIPPDHPCPVQLVQMLYNYDQVGNEVAEKIINHLVCPKGECQLKLTLDKLDPDKQASAKLIKKLRGRLNDRHQRKLFPESAVSFCKKRLE